MAQLTVHSIPSTTKNQNECTKRLSECRTWIDSQLNEICDNTDVPENIKKFVFDMAAQIVLYSQEINGATFNYSAKDEK